MLVLHIGLPKTATTFLQYGIFAPVLGGGFLHRRMEGDGEQACRLIKAYIRAADGEEAALLVPAVDILRRHAGEHTSIVTDESLSVDKEGFWSGNGPTPAQVARRLGAIRTALRDVMPTVRVLIGVRRQDTWLASRYAQSSKSMKDFCQGDFDRRADEISREASHGSSMDWLDYSIVRSAFLDEFADEDLKLFSMEKLKSQPDSVLAELGQFAGGLDFVGQRARALAAGEPLLLNLLSVGDDEWRLSGKRGILRLSPLVKAKLLERFAASNEALGRYVDLHFA